MHLLGGLVWRSSHTAQQLATVYIKLQLTYISLRLVLQTTATQTRIQNDHNGNGQRTRHCIHIMNAQSVH